VIGSRKGVKFQKAERRVYRSHWDMDEEFDAFGLDIVGDLNLKEIKWVCNEENHLALVFLINNGIKDVLYCLGQEEIHGETVNVGGLEGVNDVVAVIVQTLPGDAEFSQGKGGVRECE
jgi:hypothetical protein